MELLLASSAVFGSCILSALVPAVNAELLLLAAAAALPTHYALPLIIAATAGQMIGKSIMFFGGRGVQLFQRGRIKEKVAQVSERIGARGTVGGLVVFASASAGVPPFYVVSIASGLAGMSFTRFVVLGSAGRFLRFAAVVLIPQLVKLFLA